MEEFSGVGNCARLRKLPIKRTLQTLQRANSEVNSADVEQGHYLKSQSGGYSSSSCSEDSEELTFCPKQGFIHVTGLTVLFHNTGINI